METHYEFNGRRVTGDELVSLANCLHGDVQRAQAELARMTDKWRDTEMKRVELDAAMYDSRKKYFSLEHELEQLREQTSVENFRIRCKNLFRIGIGSYLALSLMLWNLDISEWGLAYRTGFVLTTLFLAVFVDVVTYLNKK